ncbi:MAG: hypothetical protein AABZ45_00745 [Pseudomonadota bacterium]
MRKSFEALPTLVLVSAMLALTGCGSGGTRTPAPAATPAPTPAPTTTTLDVLPCLNQTVPLARVPAGTRVIDLVIPDTITIWPDRDIGFPNGRLLSDPVIDITLGIVLLDINRAGQNAASFAAIPLDPPGATKDPIATFPFAALPNGNPPLDAGTGTGFVFDTSPMSAYVQVDRMGMPAVATALILGPRKTAYSDGNVQLDTANTYAFDLIEGTRRFSEPLQDDLTARGLTSCAVRRVS